MAELDKLVIEISADDAAFVRSLATIKNSLSEFGNQGTASAEEVSKALKAVEKAALNTNDAVKKKELVEAYVALNTELQRVKKEFKELTKIVPQTNNEQDRAATSSRNLSKGLGEVDQSARRARVALYGANQIVRDLPFGFIAISNNIPVALDQFQALVQETGSVNKAIKSLGGALLGAGGLSIAFSVISSALVGLVQQYGSLANAINTVFDLVDKETLARIKLKEATAESSAATLADAQNIRLLVDTMLDANKTSFERINSYNELKRIAPGVLQDLSRENILLGESTSLIQGRTEELLKYIELKGRESALIKLVAAEEEKRLKETLKFNQLVTGEGQTWINDLQYIATGILFRSIDKPILDIAKGIGSATKQTKVFSDELLKTRKEILALNGLVTGQQAPDQTGDEEQKRLKKLADEEARRKKEVQDRIAAYRFELETLKQTLATTSELTNEYARIKSEIIRIEAAIDKLQQPLLGLKIDLRAKDAINEVQTELKDTRFEAGRIRFTPIFDFTDETLKELERTIPKTIKLKGTELPLNIPPELIESFKKYNLELALAKERTEQLNPIIQDIAGILQRSLSSFIDDFIDGFKDGQLAIEDFQAALKELGKTILKELAKLALLTAIRAISESVAPGSGAGTAGVASRLLGTAAPRIGPGLGGGLAVGPGGLAIQGNVTFVQRGQDLVGVLARSNARINRVG